MLIDFQTLGRYDSDVNRPPSGRRLASPRKESAVRKSREEAAKTRGRIIAAASAEFREHGIMATGLAGLMKAAGLTHGGFYKHFSSKDELVREVTATSLDASTAMLRASVAKRPDRKGINV